MKILQSFLVFMFLAKSSDAECNDVYIVNRKNLPTQRCLALGERDRRGPGFLMRLEECTGAPEQRFKIVIHDSDLFYIKSNASGRGNWDTAYMRRGQESGEMEVPSRMRMDNGCNNCITKFRLDNTDGAFHYIEIDEYDNDYCITGQGSAQEDGRQIIVHDCSDNPRFEWYFTTNLDYNEETIRYPLHECS